MRVTGIKLANVRSLKTAELDFQPGFNLIVGDNGVGKTTLLNALSFCLFEFERVYNRSNIGVPKPFRDDDIRVEAESLNVECGICFGGSLYRFVMHQVRGQSAKRRRGKGFVGGATTRRARHTRRHRSGGVTRAALGSHVLDE